MRFLSDVGGGTVAGFQGKGIVLVEDEDGFQMPVPVNEVVVITTTDHNIAIPQKAAPNQPKPREPHFSKEQPAPVAPVSEDPAERPLTYKPKPLERKDGERLNLYLDFLPVDVKEFTRTTFETYLVNDCNYYVTYTYLSRENAVWHLRAQGIAEPNTKVFLEEISHAQLNDIEHVTIQALAWKEDKPFVLKPALTLQPRMDTTKFYKLHTFHPSLFFDEPVLELPLVLDDQPVRPLHISSEALQQAMQEKHDLNVVHKSDHSQKRHN